MQLIVIRRLTWSPDCRHLQINQRLTEICGISAEDHLGRSVRECVPGLAEAVEDIVQVDERYWITYWHPLRSPSGEIVGVNVAAEEVTERKRAEAALLASEQEIRRPGRTMSKFFFLTMAAA